MISKALHDFLNKHNYIISYPLYPSIPKRWMCVRRGGNETEFEIDTPNNLADAIEIIWRWFDFEIETNESDEGDFIEYDYCLMDGEDVLAVLCFAIVDNSICIESADEFIEGALGVLIDKLVKTTTENVITYTMAHKDPVKHQFVRRGFEIEVELPLGDVFVLQVDNQRKQIENV